MKILLRGLLFPFLLFFCSCGTYLTAQSDTGNYIKVTYLYVDTGQNTMFNDLVTTWKSEKADLIENNDLLAWRLYHVPFSSNQIYRYNFVSVEIASNLQALEADIYIHPEMMAQVPDIILQYAIHSEIWRTEAAIYGEETPPSRYLNANFMNAQSEAREEYLELEMDLAQPLHQHQVENNRMDGWSLNRLVFPTGTTVPYNFITTDFYSRLEQIEMGITREMIIEVHPDMDVDEFEEYADSIRERVWSDLWELVEFAE